MKKITFVFIIIILFSKICYANDNFFDNKLIITWKENRIENKIEEKKIKLELTKYNNFLNSHLNKININISINFKENDFSFSNGNPNECKIYIYYKNYDRILLPTFKKDIIFIILHEASHCILNKEIMYRPVEWNKNIKNGKIFQDYIEIQEKKYLDKKITVPPMLVYHEIYADTLASLLMLCYGDMNKKELNYLIKIRLINEKKINNPHLSYNALNKVKNLNNISILNNIDNNALIIAQYSFIEYLKINK